MQERVQQRLPADQRPEVARGRVQVRRVQAKLVVGRADDPLEREADRIADAVLARTVQPSVPVPWLDYAAPTTRIRRAQTTPTQRDAENRLVPSRIVRREPAGDVIARDFDDGYVGDDRAPRSGRRRKPPRRALHVLAGPRADRKRGGRKGARMAMDDELEASYLDSYGIDVEEDDQDDWQVAADEYFEGLEVADESTEDAGDDGLAARLVATAAESREVQVAEAKVEQAAEPVVRAAAQVEVAEAKVAAVQEIAASLPDPTVAGPVVEQAVAQVAETKATAKAAADVQTEVPQIGVAVKDQPAPQVALLAEVKAHLDFRKVLWSDLDADQQAKVLAFCAEMQAVWDPDNHTEVRKVKGKVQRYKERLSIADNGFKAIINGIADRRHKAMAEAKAEAHAKQFPVDFEDDKAALIASVPNAKVSAAARKVFVDVLQGLRLSSGSFEEVKASHPEEAIVEAARQWKFLISKKGRVGGRQMKAMTELWSPGWSEDTVAWKQRGPVWERTRNFMVTAGKHTVNVHVSPPGPRQSKTKPTS